MLLKEKRCRYCLTVDKKLIFFSLHKENKYDYRLARFAHKIGQIRPLLSYVFDKHKDSNQNNGSRLLGQQVFKEE